MCGMKKLLFLVVLVALSLGMVGAISSVKADDNNSPRVSKIPKPTPNLVCIQSAVSKRESAIGSAWSTLSSAITSALSVRKDALVAAWGVTNAKDRRIAIRTAWDVFAKSNRDARKVLKDARNSAWSQYKTDAKACKVPASEISGENMKNDNL